MRDNMLIYRSFYEAIQDLPLEDQAIVWNAIYELGLNGKDSDLKGVPNTVFKLIRPQIEANIRRYQNGKSPKKNQDKSETEAKDKQIISETETNNNINNNSNNNKSLSNRKQEFYNLLTPFVNQYSKEMLRQFFDYWTEHGINDKKMRFEKEKSFGISRRLSTWNQNNQNKKIEIQSDDKLVNYIKNQINSNE